MCSDGLQTMGLDGRPKRPKHGCHQSSCTYPNHSQPPASLPPELRRMCALPTAACSPVWRARWRPCVLGYMSRLRLYHRLRNTMRGDTVLLGAAPPRGKAHVVCTPCSVPCRRARPLPFMERSIRLVDQAAHSATRASVRQADYTVMGGSPDTTCKTFDML